MNTRQEIIPFSFGEQAVRPMLIDGEPWFAAKDVCDILGLENSQDVLSKLLHDDERGIKQVYALTGYQDINVINEFGLYNLILRSNKPEAEAFRMWVTAVLPIIRKKGYYGVPAGDCSDRRLKMLLKAYASKVITSTQFNFLAGVPPEDCPLFSGCETPLSGRTG